MVTDDFNPYHEWLGLDSQLGQPGYYQLLGVEPSETNMMQISAAADRAAARVRSIRPGPRAAEWAKVLDEIASAKSCLSDPTRRAQYDRQLATSLNGAGSFHRPAPRDKMAAPLPTPAQPNAYPTGAPMSTPAATPVQPTSAPLPAGPAATPFPTATQPASPAAAPHMPHGPTAPSAGTPSYAAPVAPGTPYPTQQTPGSPVMPTATAAPLGGAPAATPQAYPSGIPQPSPSGPMPTAPVAGVPVSPAASPQTSAAGTAPHALGYVAGGATPVPGTAVPTGIGSATGQYGTASSANPATANLPTGVPLGGNATAAATAPTAAGPGVRTGSERSATKMVRKRADRSKSLPLLAAGLGGAILVIAIVLLAVIGGGGDDDGKNGTDRKSATHTRPAVKSPIATPRPSGRRSRPSRNRPPVSTRVTETRKEPEPESVQRTEPGTSLMDPETGTPGETMELPKTPVVDTPPESTPTPTEPQPGDVSKPPVSGPPPDPTEMSPEPKTDLPPAIVPQPKPQQTVQPTPAELAALATALKSARTKLESSDFEGALAELKKVESLPKLPEHQAKCERLRLLTEYARDFRSALGEAIKNLEAGDEISAGGNAAAGVVGVTADEVVLKVNGRNRSYPISDLSPGLAVAIANTWLDQDDPVCLVAKAAYLASLKNARDDRLAKAREWFQEASKSGVDIGDLAKVIDDKYDELEKDLAPQDPE